MQIGQELQTLRHEKKLTQEELAVKTDLTKGYISQLEHDQASPSMGTLLDILGALGSSPANFFYRVESNSNQIVFHENEQPVIEKKSSYEIKSLVPKKLRPLFEPLMIKLAGNQRLVYQTESTGHAFVQVLSGKLQINIEDQIVSGQENDSFYFSTAEKCDLINPTTTETKLLIVANVPKQVQESEGVEN